MLKLKFVGAAGTVTGSSSLLSYNGKQVLIDLGMYQGPAEVALLNRSELEFNPSELSAVVLTHAHLDHCGRLPLLVAGGFSGSVYTTEASYELLKLVLYDAVKVGSMDEGEALYSDVEVEKLLSLVKIVKYREVFELFSGVSVEFYDAGHILGSASVLFSFPEFRVLFSGDLGNSPEDLIMPTQVPDQADYVVMESTYGDRLHKRESSADVFVEEVREIEKSGGVLLIPCFSLQRTQEVLHKFNHLKSDRLISPELEVILDGPMGIAATEIFGRFSSLYNEELSSHAKKENPFEFPGLRVMRGWNGARKLKSRSGPAVVIAGSGMMSGGRILSYAKIFLPSKINRLLFVGYQGEETLGREILDKVQLGGVPFEVVIGGKKVVVNSSVRQVDMSAHADQSQLLAWLKKIRGIRKIFLNHGEDVSRDIMAKKIKPELGLEAVIPAVGDEIVLE